MKKEHILVADDDESVVWLLERFFTEKGLSVTTARDGITASRILKKEDISLAFIDINMPGRDGLRVLKEMDLTRRPLSVIIITGEDTMKNTLEAMKNGAFDYITKPFDLDELDVIVEKALENIRLKRKVVTLERQLKERVDEPVFVGRSRAVRELLKTIGKIAPKDVTVLIQGESGTGKELLARLVHMNSPRADGPFIAVNSAAIPRELMESELFGFEKGAFTGAVEEKKGKFELAHGGTLFLDEIGDMSLDLQAKLLRVIQEREFFRIGGKVAVRVDVRIITATHQDLKKAVEEKRFREDLYYRLNVVSVNVPPLRQRKGDIRVLSEFFLDRFVEEMKVERKTLSEEAIEALERYHWPGNVRELENVLKRAVLLSPGVVLTPQDLSLPERKRKTESIEDIITAKLKPVIEKTSTKGCEELYNLIIPFMERPLIRLVLERTRGNQIQASRLLGINRNTLRKKIKELGIDMREIKR